MSYVNGPDALLKDSNGCYFLDRCPRPFEVILGFLRTGELTNLNGCTKRQLEVEADFFGLSGLQEILRQGGQAPKAQEDLPDWMRELEAVDKEIHRICIPTRWGLKHQSCHFSKCRFTTHKL